MTEFISANPDDDFISDREDQWRRYAKRIEIQRDRMQSEITGLVRQRDLLTQDNSRLEDENTRLKLQLKRWEAGFSD